MEKDKKIVSKRMLQAILIAQIFGFLCLCVLKYNMDVFSVNYRNIETKCYNALLLLEEISSDVYEHETLISRYVVSDDLEAMNSYETSMKTLREQVELNLIKCDVAIESIDSNHTHNEYKEFSDSLVAYFNCAEIAMDLKKEDPELALFLLNHNMVFYIETANESMDVLDLNARDNLTSANKSMAAIIRKSRYSFMIGAIITFLATGVCLWYCRKLLAIQYEYMVQADSANKAKSVFLSSMSHEIRTPINAIIGLNEMITRETADEKVANYSAKVDTASRNLLGLINDILDFSKIEAGKMNIIESSYRVDDMLSEVWDMISVRAKGKNLKLNFRVYKDLPVGLVGDGVRLKQIIVNILTNAVKYTNEGSVDLIVKFERLSENEIFLRVAVKDTGMGINPNEIEKLSKAFERIDEKKNSSIEGTGLGLSIVNSILHMMDSKLEVYSIYGEGSTFSFVVKQKVDDWTTVGDFNPELARKTLSVKKKKVFHASAAKVLAVDDNEMNRMVIEELLKRTGVQLTLAKGGQEAYDLAVENCYDVILMDHRMPGVDGVQALHLIKNYGKNKRTPIIAVTANAGIEMNAFYTNEGFESCIGKPINAKELEATLAKNIPENLWDESEDSEADKTEVEVVNKVDDKIQIKDNLQLKLARAFISSADETYEEIKNFKESGDLENYAIKVHALKSTAKMVGALNLSEEARTLEAGADNKNLELVNEKTDELLEHLKAVVKQLTAEVSKQEGV